MSVDATSIRYICPFCDWDGSTPRSVKSHVSATKVGKHRGVNGYTMDRVIETTEDPSKLPMIDRIRRAAQEFEEPLDKDDADEVADAASITQDNLTPYVSRYMILRIWKDAGFDLEVYGPSNLYYKDLTKKQQEAISYIYHTDLTDDEIDEKIDASRNYTHNLKEKHLYLTHKKFASEELKENDPTSQGDKVLSDGNGEDMSITINNKKIRALEASGVDHEVNIHIEEDNFKALEKLIKAGYSGVAQEIFEE